MFVRIVLLTFALGALLACGKDKPKDGPTSNKPGQSSMPPPPEGPCAADADCKVYLEPCSCGCLAHVGDVAPIPNDTWGTVCGGGPPGNCGVASPCMNVTATCDATTKKCQLKR